MSPSLYDQIKKNDFDNKRHKQKYLFSIILSNILIACATSQFFSKKNLVFQNTTIKSEPMNFHLRHKLVVIPVNNLVPIDSLSKETPITLLSSENKVVIAKAYLYKKIISPQLDNSKDYFQVEIPENELIKLINQKNESLTAVPQIDSQIISQYQNHQTKESKYEIHF